MIVTSLLFLISGFENLLGKKTVDSGSSDDVAPIPVSVSSSSANAGSTQPMINATLHLRARDAYKKLLRTAYIMAVSGQPLTSFTTMVAVQKANGVQLLSKTDSSDKAREFVQVLSDTVRAKIINALDKESSCFSVLSDGSQARKTGSEKELVFARTLKNGAPIYYCVALQDIDAFGDANAENVKASIDDVFQNPEKIHISAESFQKHLVGVTADGAAVNTGIYNGVLTRLRNDNRPWLVTIHCVSHRVELALNQSTKRYRLSGHIKLNQSTKRYRGPLATLKTQEPLT